MSETIQGKRLFPTGKFYGEEEGEVNVSIRSDKLAGCIILNFGEPVRWLGVRKAEAEELGETLLRMAKGL